MVALQSGTSNNKSSMSSLRGTNDDEVKEIIESSSDTNEAQSNQNLVEDNNLNTRITL